MTESNDKQIVAKAATALALVSGASALVVCAMMAWNYSRFSGLHVDTPELANLKTKVYANPSDPAAKEHLRTLDQELRTDYVRHSRFARTGSMLLLGSVALCLLCAGVARAYRVRRPLPRGEQPRPATALALWGVSAMGALLAAVGVVGILTYSGSLLTASPNGANPALQTKPAIPATNAATLPLPTAEEIAKQWPCFRGPRQGVSAFTNVPDTWNAKTGENILWKTPIPLSGKNSPVVWGDKVFVTGADGQNRGVYCFDALGGKLLWQYAVKIPGSPAKPPEVIKSAGFAVPTAATDGRHLFAVFANGDLVCLNFDGKPAWSKALGLPDNSYGWASSLATWRNRVFVLMDQGGEGDKKSRLYAFDADTGQQAWVAKRDDAPASWASPIVIDTPQGPQLITCANPWVIAYDPAKGAEVWRAKVDGGEVAPSPIYAGGLVFTANQGAQLAALRTDGRGDVTDKRLWSGEDGLPDITSPLSDGKQLWLVTTEGQLTCYDAQTGKKIYEQDLAQLKSPAPAAEGAAPANPDEEDESPSSPPSFQSSPSLVGEKVYLIDSRGGLLVIAAGPQFKVLARGSLGENCFASPAFADGRIYLRTSKTLYCLGKQ